MLNFLIILAALAAAFALIVKFLDEVGLQDSGKVRLQKRFEDWWLTVSDMNRLSLALAFATRLSHVVDTYFGVRLISKRAFTRCFVISTLLLVFLLGVFGIYNDRVIGIAPWEAYRETASRLEQVWSDDQKPAKTDAEKAAKQANAELLAIVVRFNTGAWTAAYTVVSLVILVLLNSILLFLSVVYSRLILREIIAAGRVFSTLTLLIANFALLIPGWIVLLLLLTVLFTPWLWLIVPVFLLLSKASFYWTLAFIAGGGIAGLAFGSTPLKVITVAGFLPCVLTAIVTALSAIVLLNRDGFHRVLSSILLKCAEKGPLKVALAVLLIFSGLVFTCFQAARYMR
jgi:hypothetical protein